MRYTIIFTVLSFFSGTYSSYGQTKKELIQWMKNGHYQEAYKFLETNYKKYPKDADYIFYTGVCRVQLNTNIAGALELLKEATLQNSYKESWFYLGRAFMLNYQFSEAEEAFSRYNDKASKDEKDRIQLQMYKAMCRNGRDLCRSTKKPLVTKVDTVQESELINYLNKQKIGGTLVKTVKSEGLSSKKHEEYKYSGNQITLHSRYTLTKKYKDIYFSDEDSIRPDNLKNLGYWVNSTEEEAFVFYDPTTPALYFSSQGHNSAGGYDIFKSYYDKITKKWSKPVNLGFPINTPFEEVAYVTIPGTSQSILASRRNAQPGKLVIYTFENAESCPEEQVTLDIVPAISNLKVGNAYPTTPKNQIVHTKSTANPKNEVPVEFKNEPIYQNLIHEALNLQIQSDSIKRLSDEKKEKLISAKNESDKTKLWQEIRALDAKAEEVQLKADILYKKAREMEGEKQQKSQSQTWELVQKPNNHRDTLSVTVALSNNSAAVPVNSNDINNSVHYRIQVGVFSKPQRDETFKGFSNLYKETLRDGTIHKYYVGLYNKVADAERNLIKVKEAGFKDAYIIGFYNGKIVPLSRARELELSLQKQ